MMTTAAMRLTGIRSLARAAARPKVYAVDIEKAMVDYIRQRAAKEGLTQVVAVQGSATAANLREPVDVAIREGRRLGREAKKLAHADLLSLMPEDIDEVRARLNIGTPVAYLRCIEMFRQIDPDYGLLEERLAQAA